MTFFVRRFADDSIWLAQKSIDFSCDSALCTNNNNERRIRTNRQFSFSFFARSMRYARYALCARAPNLCVQLLFDIFLAEVFARFKFVCLCVINSIYYSVEENAQIHLPRHSATLPNCECCRALEFGTVMWPNRRSRIKIDFTFVGHLYLEPHCAWDEKWKFRSELGVLHSLSI